MFFAKEGEFEACGLFSSGHFALLFLTILSVIGLVLLSKNKTKSEIKKEIKFITLLMWVFEFFRIGYKLYCGDYMFLESYMPLFYCSIFLYAGLLSSFGRGIFQRTGDVVLATGSLVGGIIFLIFPTTSLPTYPAFHFVSIHSFLYHGAMVYVGLTVLATRYIELNKKDIWRYFSLVVVLCLVALVINNIFDCNLMFISNGFPGRLGKELFLATGKFYTPLAILVHLFLPYYVVYGINKKLSLS